MLVLLRRFVLADFHIMGFDVRWHAGQAAVAHFCIVFVENFVQFCVLWEMFVYEFQEFFAYVCRNTFAERGVIPDDLSPAFRFLLWGFLCNAVFWPSVLTLK